MAMTTEQLETLRAAIARRIEALQAEIHAEVDRTRDETYGEVSGGVPDTGDEAVADVLTDITNAQTTRDLVELRALEYAQERIRAGTYGSCADCGYGIEFERLLACPEAIRCTPCQTAHEKTYAHPSEPSL